MEYVAVKASDLIFLMLAFSVNLANFTQFITYGEYLQFYKLLLNPIFAKRAKHLRENAFCLFLGAIQICRTESNVVKEHGKKMNGTIL